MRALPLSPTRSNEHALASIVLNFGEPDRYGFAEYRTWREKEFFGETESEVKSKVETWVQEQFDEVRALLGITTLQEET